MLGLGVLVVLGRGIPGDLSPPFVFQDDRKISGWELRGYAVVHEDSILILPPVALKGGGIWCDMALPSSWSASFSFRVDRPNGGALMIWLSSAYGVEDSKNGVRIQVRFTPDATIFGVDIGGNGVVLRNGVQPAVMGEFVLKVGVSGGHLAISYGSLDEKVRLGGEGVGLFLGITSKNDRSWTRIDVRGIRFEEGKGLGVGRSIEAQSQERADFSRGGSDFASWGPVSDVGGAFDAILNVSRLVDGLPSFTAFNDVVLAGVLPHVDKWHRRVLTVVEDIRELRYRLNETIHGVLASLQGMSDVIQANSNKLHRRASRVTEAFLEEMDSLPEATIPEPGWTVGKVLPLVGVVELVAFGGFVLCLKFSPRVRRIFI